MIKPTKPIEPNDSTNPAILPTTSLIKALLPNNKFATMPNPSNDTKIPVKPDTKDPAFSIILFINTSYDLYMNNYYTVYSVHCQPFECVIYTV